MDVEIPPEAVPSQAPQAELVNVIDPDTQQVGSIPSHQLQEALSQGYEPASPEQVTQFFNEQKFGGAGQQALTALEGAASAATFGGSTGIETKMLGVKPEDIQARRETNPKSHLTGQIAGIVGSSFIPGMGEAEALESGAKAIHPLSAQSILSGAGEKAVKALGLGGENAGRLSSLGADATRGAIETALFQSGDEVSKAFSDPDQSIGLAAANIGLSGLMGAGLNAAVGGVSKLWDAKMGNNLGGFLEDFKGRVREHLENPNLAGMLGDELQHYYKNISEMADEVYGPQGLKAQEIQKVIPEMSEKMTAQAQALTDNLKQTIDFMANRPNAYPARLVSKLLTDYETLQNSLTQAQNPGEIFNALQDLKQQMQSYGKFDKFVKPVDEAYDFVQKSKSLSHELRTALEDKAVWGKAAERQQVINDAFKKFLPTLQDFEKRFTVKIADEDVGGFKRVIDPGKINTYLNQLGKPNAEIKQQMLENFLNASEKYKGVINETHANLGLESPFEPSALLQAKKTLDELTPGAKLADAFIKKGLSRLAGEGLGIGIGGTVGHALGSGFIGALIGEHALGPFFSSILPALVKPLLENPTSARGFKDAVELGLNVTKGEGLVTKATKNVFKAGAEVLPSHLLPSEKKLERLKDQIQKAQTEPERLLQNPSQSASYLPSHQQALSQTVASGANYLHSLSPSIGKNRPLDQERIPSAAEKATYERSLQIAEQPLVVLEHLKKGELVPQDLVTLKTLYPSLYQSLSQKLMQSMTDAVSKHQAIPYGTRLSLSLFFAEPLDSTMTPSSLQATQTSLLMPTKSPEQAPAPKHSTSALQKAPALFQTAAQAREQSRLSH